MGLDDKATLPYLMEELEFWQGLDKALIDAEPVYWARKHEILTLRRKLNGIVESIETDVRWLRRKDKRIKEGGFVDDDE